jgi:hypothetical protein
MRFPSAIPLLALVILPFIASCSALRTGNAVPAAYESDKPGWASKYIPGVKSISEIVPPPSEARTNWDRWYEKRNGHWKARDE